MTSNKPVESTIIQEHEPDWDPLEDMLGPEGHDEFEWRAEVELDTPSGWRGDHSLTSGVSDQSGRAGRAAL